MKNKETIEKEYYNSGNIKRKYYYLNNKIHKENGPALIYYYDNGNIEGKIYYLNDKRHREDGPAIIWYYNNGDIESEEYYLNGIKCDLLQEMVIQGLEMENING